jgi:hypothetical protein
MTSLPFIHNMTSLHHILYQAIVYGFWKRSALTNIKKDALKHIINRLWYGIFHITCHINPRPIYLLKICLILHVSKILNATRFLVPYYTCYSVNFQRSKAFVGLSNCRIIGRTPFKIASRFQYYQDKWLAGPHKNSKKHIYEQHGLHKNLDPVVMNR